MQPHKAKPNTRQQVLNSVTQLAKKVNYSISIRGLVRRFCAVRETIYKEICIKGKGWLFF